jgi:hypothetical protein
MLVFYQYVGSISSLWSLLERAIDEECWRLAGINSEIGECFTAQTSQARAKMISLEALVALMGGSADLRKKLRRYRDTVITNVGEKRNRTIHDPIYKRLDSEDIVIDTITLSAKGKLKHVRSPSISDLRDTLHSIRSAYEEFEKFTPDLRKLYPTSD